jgi:glucose repression regulatory protein TUP1
MHDGSSKIFLPDTDSSEVASLALSPDGSFVATGCLDSTVRIWEVKTGRLVEQLNGHENLVFTLAFTPDGKGLISGGVDNTLNHWDVSALTLGNHSPTPDPSKSSIQPTFTMEGHRDIVYSVAVSHDGQWIVSGSRDRTVLIWDASNGVVHCMIDGHWDSVCSVDLSPVGNYLVTGGGNGEAKIWHLESRHDQG